MRDFPHDLVVVDMETDGIEAYPDYPPKPCGVSIRWEDGKCEYLAWGHAEGKNCTFEEAKRAVRRAFRLPCLFHNSPFDLEVARVHMGLAGPLERHDTLYMAFLCEPHAASLSLKPLAEQILGMKPEEKDALVEWAHKNLGVPRSQAMAHVPKMPADLVGKYAIGDVKRTYKLAARLWDTMNARDLWSAYDRERLLAPWLTDAERRGVRVDRQLLHDWRGQMTHSLAVCDARLNVRVGMKVNWDANDEVVEALRAFIPAEEWPRTATGKLSTSLPVLRALLRDVDLYNMLAYRNKSATLLRTFIEPWLELSEKDGRIHPGWSPVRNPDGNGARTGRIASMRPNLANVPNKQQADPPEGLSPLPELRQALLPEEGHLWLSADYSQQELRLLAHYENGDLLKAYTANSRLDLHQYAADLVQRRVGVTLTRKDAKILGFSIIYGAGAAKIAEQLGVDEDTARMFKEAYLKALPGVADLSAQLKRRFKSNLSIRTIGGRVYYVEKARGKVNAEKADEYAKLRVRLVEIDRYMTEHGHDDAYSNQAFEILEQMNNLQRDYGAVTKASYSRPPFGLYVPGYNPLPLELEAAGRGDLSYKGLNVLIQGSAADQTKAAIISACRSMPRARLLTTVYDEINLSVPADEVEQHARLLHDAMVGALPLDVPVECDLEAGPNWAAIQPLGEAA